MSTAHKFRPRARLLLQLGDQLIKNESVALLELVKNSYDAGATLVEIKMSNLNNPNTGTISIFDDGSGMDYDIVTKVWLEPGSDYKAQILKNIENEPLPFKRKPLGEKGIGRFSAHKLGKTVELISRQKNKDEVYVKIDWDSFEQYKYIDEVPIDVIKREPEIFKGKHTGTFLKISNLRTSQWSDVILKEIYRSINAICSPFDTPDSFNVLFEIDKPSIFEDIPTINEIKKLSLYSFQCEIEKNEITKFSYEFTPYVGMKKLKKKKFTYNVKGETNNIENFETTKKMVLKAVRNPETGVKESPPIDLGAGGMNIGKLKFEGWIFDRQSKVLKYAEVDTKGLREYLNGNGGVRVYRDGIRVYDYGEPENDWLGLEKSRLYDPGVKINKGLILAAVHLERESSSSLVEQTNREGFVDNLAYRAFRDAVTYAIKIIEGFRNEDKDDVRLYYGISEKTEPVLATVAELKDIIELKVLEEKVKKECLSYLDKIENEYKEVNEILLTSAEAGLNLSVAIHEIEKIALELKIVVKEESSSNRIIKLIEHLSELIRMYGTLVRKSKKKIEDVITLTQDALFNVQYRLKAHDVEIVDEFSSYRGDASIKCSSRLVMGSIVNLIDNSIYWLDRAKVKNKKILIRLHTKSQALLELTVADNGNGFALPPEQLTKPFVSLKPGGMGLGLHITSEVMNTQGGYVEFPSFANADLPREYSKGAIISLLFRKENV
jgi:signal transduction histidine kinase